MKKLIKTIVMTVICLVSVQLSKMMAQAVVPTTTDVSLFCSDGVLDLGAPAAGEEWVVNYSALPTTTPTEGVTLTGNTIPAGTLKTGYYYVASKGTAEGSCTSEMKELPIYVFKPLTVTFTATKDSYCIEDVAAQTFSATVTATGETYNTFAYQWYTVTGGVESAIPGATTATYKPSATAAATTTYRVKSGYLVGSLRYCSDTFDKDITVTTKPSTPVITVGGKSTGETW